MFQVFHVEKSPDFKTSGTWSLTTKDLTTGHTQDHVFDAVMLCTGHLADKNIPDFSGNHVKNFMANAILT